MPSSHSRSRTPSKIYIDPSKAYAWATKQAEQNEHLQLFFDRYCEKFGGTCLTVTYERLSSKNAVWAFAELRLAIFGESVACAPGAAPRMQPPAVADETSQISDRISDPRMQAPAEPSALRPSEVEEEARMGKSGLGAWGGEAEAGS